MKRDFLHALDIDHTSDPDACANYCDICAARRQGLIYVAAHLLHGATETPTLDRVITALDMPRNLNGRPRGWTRWVRWFKRNTIKCPSCESFVFTDVPHTSCGNCLTPLE